MVWFSAEINLLMTWHEYFGWGGGGVEFIYMSRELGQGIYFWSLKGTYMMFQEQKKKKKKFILLFCYLIHEFWMWSILWSPIEIEDILSYLVLYLCLFFEINYKYIWIWVVIVLHLCLDKFILWRKLHLVIVRYNT